MKPTNEFCEIEKCKHPALYYFDDINQNLCNFHANLAFSDSEQVNRKEINRLWSSIKLDGEPTEEGKYWVTVAASSYIPYRHTCLADFSLSSGYLPGTWIVCYGTTTKVISELVVAWIKTPSPYGDNLFVPSIKETFVKNVKFSIILDWKERKELIECIERIKILELANSYLGKDVHCSSESPEDTKISILREEIIKRVSTKMSSYQWELYKKLPVEQQKIWILEAVQTILLPIIDHRGNIIAEVG